MVAHRKLDFRAANSKGKKADLESTSEMLWRQLSIRRVERRFPRFISENSLPLPLPSPFLFFLSFFSFPLLSSPYSPPSLTPFFPPLSLPPFVSSPLPTALLYIPLHFFGSLLFYYTFPFALLLTYLHYSGLHFSL